METSTQLFERMLIAARELAQQNDEGALHIFVADGNCDDENIEFCIWEPNITEAERDFAARMLREFTEKQRYGVYAFAQCPDICG